MKTTWTNLTRNQFVCVKPVIGGSDCVFIVSVETRFPFSNQKKVYMGGMFFVILSVLLSLLSYCTFITLICMHPCFCMTSHILCLRWNDLMQWQRWVLLLYLLLCLFYGTIGTYHLKKPTNQSPCKIFLSWKTVEFIRFLVIAMAPGIANK